MHLLKKITAYIFLFLLVAVQFEPLAARGKGRSGGYHDSKYFRDSNYTHYRAWGGWNDRYWGSGINYGVGEGNYYYRPSYYYSQYPYTYRNSYPVTPLYDYDTTYFFVTPP